MPSTGGAGAVLDWGDAGTMRQDHRDEQNDGVKADEKVRLVKEKRLHALFLSKLVYKQGRVTVSPEDAFRLSGLLPDTSKEDSKEVMEVAAWSEAEREVGMKIVEQMLTFELLRDERVGNGEGIVTRSIWG